MDSANVLTLEIAKLVLKPGDVLVIRYPRLPDVVELARLQKELDRVLPKDVKALLLGRETELTVISANG